MNNVQTMKKIKDWAKSNNLLNDESIILGIALDDPKTTKPENCRYDTCIVISDDFAHADSINQANIVGGKYVVFTIDHTADAVHRAWIDIFPELLGQGYQMDETRPIIKRYKAKMGDHHYCKICVPVH